MADTKISALSAGTTPSAGNTTFVAVQSSANVKLTDAALAAGVKATYGLTLNATSTSDPTVNSDTTAGYTLGSRWFNTSTGLLFIARDVTAAAAVWEAQQPILSPAYIASRFYPGMDVTAAVGGAINSSAARLHPFMPRRRVTISDLGALVVGGAAGNFQLAIWATDPTNNLPTSTPLGYTAANLSSASNAFVSGALNANVTVEGGRLYWLGLATDQTTATWGGWAASTSVMSSLIGAAVPTDYITVAGTSLANFWSYTHTFANGLNTLNITSSSVTATGGTTQRAALIHFKTASPTP